MLITACSVSDGERRLVVVPNPFEKTRTGDVCIDSPIQAYIDGVTCQNKLIVTRHDANARLDVIRGGCALQYSILNEKLNIFEELLAKGGNLNICPNYPSSIYAAVTHVCRDNITLAHKFFDVIEKQGTYKDYPQVLLWHSTLLRCVEGVKISLKYGATPNQPARKDWDDGLLRPMALYSPLEGAILNGWQGNPEGTVEIANILIDAGAFPWGGDDHGESIFKQAEKRYAGSIYWPQIRAALLRARSKPERSN